MISSCQDDWWWLSWSQCFLELQMAAAVKENTVDPVVEACCLLNLTNSTLTSCPALLVFCEPQVPKVLLAVPFLQSDFCCTLFLLISTIGFLRAVQPSRVEPSGEHIFLCRWRCAPPWLHRREAGCVYACNLCMQCHLCVQDANRARRRDEPRDLQPAKRSVAAGYLHAHIADCFPKLSHVFKLSLIYYNQKRSSKGCIFTIQVCIEYNSNFNSRSHWNLLKLSLVPVGPASRGSIYPYNARFDRRLHLQAHDQVVSLPA